jgi:hypothetical protein
MSVSLKTLEPVELVELAEGGGEVAGCVLLGY